jgi:hypothetical protein
MKVAQTHFWSWRPPDEPVFPLIGKAEALGAKDINVGYLRLRGIKVLYRSCEPGPTGQLFHNRISKSFQENKRLSNNQACIRLKISKQP